MRPKRVGLLADGDIPVAVFGLNRTPILDVNGSHGGRGWCGPDRFSGTINYHGRRNGPADETSPRWRGHGPFLARAAADIGSPGHRTDGRGFNRGARRPV